MKASAAVVSKSKAILLVILLAGALAEAFAYSYVNSSTSGSSSNSVSLSPQPGVTSSPSPSVTPSPTPMPSPAEFVVSNLTTTPFEVGPEEPVTISIIVTNVGDLGGSFSLNVTVNDLVQGTKAVSLTGKENQVVNFTVTESKEGSYNLKVADLLGTFFVKASPPMPMPTTLKLSNLYIDPIEAWVGQNVSVSVDATNMGTENITYKLPINVDGALAANIALQLSPGVKSIVTATINASSIQSHSVNVGGLNGVLRIVPTGKHTLHVWSDREGFPFTLDGNPVTTQYDVLLDVGTHTIVAPTTFVKPIPTWGAVVFTFAGWDDGSTNPTRRIDLQRELYSIAYYTRRGSCPSLFVWNGTDYTYSAEVSDGPGWLGYINHFQTDGSIVFSYNYPWDYIKLDKNTLQPKDGYYKMNIGETSDEIFYLDSAKLVAVDHSPDVNVFSTAGTYIYNLANQGTIYTVSKNLLTPASVTNGSGQNVLLQISKMDGVFTFGTRWQWNNITLNLGDLSQAKVIKLVVAATINWPTTSSGGNNFMKYASQPGVTPSPPPYMEVKAANGSWVRVPDDRQFPLPDVTDEVFVVNLTGLFVGNDYSLRINTYQDIRFDYIGIDTTSQQSVIVQSLTPSFADFKQVLDTKSNSTGNFTRYGDVTELLLAADDKLVIGREGDSVSLKFPTNLSPVPQGMKRDFFVFASAWFKGNGLPYMPFTVDNLPFQGMTSFPYPSNESYPFDSEHLSYLREYNTRVITASNSAQAPYNLTSALSNIPLTPLSSSSALDGFSLIFYVALATCASTVLAISVLSVFKSKRKNIKVSA